MRVLRRFEGGKGSHGLPEVRGARVRVKISLGPPRLGEHKPGGILGIAQELLAQTAVLLARGVNELRVDGKRRGAVLGFDAAGHQDMQHMASLRHLVGVGGSEENRSKRRRRALSELEHTGSR